MPALVAGGGSRRDDLALRVMQKIVPDMSFPAAWRALHRSYLKEHPEAEYALDIDHDLLLEVMSMSEAKEVQGYLKEIRRVSKEYQRVRSRRRAHIPKYFDKGEPVAAAAAKAKAKPKAKAKAAATAAGSVPHWRPPLNARAIDATLFIKKHAPPSGDVWCDDYNGRWKCYFPDKAPKSVSWTKRGLHEAANVALHQLWTWHEEDTGLPSPFPIADLLTTAVAAAK